MENNSANYNQQPLVSQSPPHFSKTFIIFVAILIAVAVGLGGYMLGVNKNQTVQTQPQPVTQITQSSPTPVDETANWKTYSDGIYAFKYPNDWSAKGGYDEYYKYQVVAIWNPNQSVGIEVYPIQPPYGFGEGSPRLKQNDLKIMVDNKEYLAVENILEDGAFVDLKINKDKEYHILFGTGHPLPSKNKSLSDYNLSRDTILQILSTFKFTDQGQIISASKTSPDGSLVIIEQIQGDTQEITIKNKNGNTLIEDIVSKNWDSIISNMQKLGLKGMGQIGISFKGWVSNSRFVIDIKAGNGDIYEVNVDAGTGLIEESTFKKTN